MNDDWYWALSVMLLAALCLYLVYLLKFKEISSAGKIVITEDEEGKKMFTLEVDMNPDEIATMSYIIFKVTNQATEDLE